jgi:hypothetical protein
MSTLVQEDTMSAALDKLTRETAEMSIDDAAVAVLAYLHEHLPALIVRCPEHMTKVLRFAVQVGATEQFVQRLEYLATYAQPHTDTSCELYTDWAPFSFGFVMSRRSGGTWERWFNGGMIYEGPGQPADGSMPALTVSLRPRRRLHDWGVHT